MFNGIFDAHRHYDARVHIAQMISLLGPPPKELIARERQYRDLDFEGAVPNPKGEMAKTVCEYWGGPFFDENGNDPYKKFRLTILTRFLQGEFMYKDLIRTDMTLESTVTALEGKEKDLFLDFARCMLEWLPEKRKTAAQLLEHPFILSLENEE